MSDVDGRTRGRVIAAQLTTQRYTYRDQRTSVSAEVDGRGRVQRLEVPPDMLHRADPSTVGADLLAAIRGARQACGDAVQRQLNGEPPPQPTGRDAQPPRAPRRPPPNQPDDDDGPFSVFQNSWGGPSR